MANAEVREPDGVEEAQSVDAGEAQLLDSDATAEILESGEAGTKPAAELDERDEREAFSEDRLPMGPPLEEDESAAPEAEIEDDEDVEPVDPQEPPDEFDASP